MIFSELFTIVVDMLAILVHGTLAGELSDKGDENKKVHQSLIRKLKVCIAARCRSLVLSFAVIFDAISVHCVINGRCSSCSSSGEWRTSRWREV